MAQRLRWTALLSLLLLSAAFAPVAHASEPPHAVTIKVDGRTVPFPDAQPLFANARILVPVRFVSEALGATVGWDPVLRTATIQKGERFIRLYPSGACGLDACNGSALTENVSRLACLAPDCTDAFLLDVAPRILQDRTYVPLRFVAEALGAQVSWSQADFTADLRSGQGTGFSTATVQLAGLPTSGTISSPTTLAVTGATGSLVQLWAIDPATRQGYLLGASTNVAAPLTINGHAVPEGRYLVAAGVWIGDRWSYSYPRLVTFTPSGDPWSGEKRAWLAGYPDNLTYRYQMSVSALANFARTQVTWLLDGQPQLDHNLTFDRTFTEADNGRIHSLSAALTPTDGGPAVATDEIQFRVDARAIRTSGLTRDEVVTAPVAISAVADAGFTQVEYRVEESTGRAVQQVTKPIAEPFQLDPATLHEGFFVLAATGRKADGATVEAVPLPFYAWAGGNPATVPAATPEEQQRFLSDYLPIAMGIYGQTGLSPSLQMAQAIHESGWGKAEVRDLSTGTPSFNLFGMKARDGESFVRQVTVEMEGTQSRYYVHRFKRFDSAVQAWQARANYLLGSRLFEPIGMVRANPDAVLAVLGEFGYATDTAYRQRILALLNQPGLLPNGQSLRSLDRVQF